MADSRLPPSRKSVPPSKVDIVRAYPDRVAKNREPVDRTARLLAGNLVAGRPDIGRPTVTQGERPARGRQLPPKGRDVTYAQAVGSALEAGIAQAEGRSISVGVGDARGQAGTAIGTAAGSIEFSGSATIEVRNALPRYRASDVIASSSWTGRRPLREQVTVVSALAPLALGGVDQLATALEQKRLNDPAAQHALDALKELHAVLGDLIGLAESKRPMKRAWKRFEQAKEKLTNALWNGAQVILVAPALAMGTATFLSMLSGFPISEGMLTALCAASMTKDALLTVAKKR